MTSKMFNLFLCTCISLVMVSQCLPSGHLMQRRGGMRLCGRILAEALALVCNNVYYSPEVKKDDDMLYPGSNDPWWPDLAPKNSKSASNGYLNGQVAVSLLSKADHYRRESRGASDECCKKACSYNELSSYCGNSYEMD